MEDRTTITTREQFEERLALLIAYHGEKFGIEADMIDQRDNGDLCFNWQNGEAGEGYFAIALKEAGTVEGGELK